MYYTFKLEKDLTSEVQNIYKISFQSTSIVGTGIDKDLFLFISGSNTVLKSTKVCNPLIIYNNYTQAINCDIKQTCNTKQQVLVFAKQITKSYTTTKDQIAILKIVSDWLNNECWTKNITSSTSISNTDQ